MANWLCATFPGSPFIANLIVARPGRGHPSTLFNRRFTIRDIDGKATNGSEDDHEIHMADQDLHCAQVPCPPIDDGRLGPRPPR